MTEKDKFQAKIEKSKLLTVISSMALIASFIILFIILLSGPVYQWAGLDSYSIAIVPFVPALIFAISSLFLGIISSNAAREEEEKELLAKKKNVQKTFEGTEDVRFTAGRALVNYKKYLPYVLSVLCAVAMTLMLFSFWRYWSLRVEKILPANSIHVAFTAAVFMCASIFGGIFCIGQSKEKEFRWLRPVGAWLVVGFLAMLFAGIAALANKYGYPRIDTYLAKTLFVIFVILTAEFVIAFVTEFYRPRTSIESERPVFESRLLSLFTEPGGVVRNIADTLDYQFGFKVSKTWIYSFVEKAIVPLIILWLFSLWMLTCISEVGPNEVGLRERFGKLITEKSMPAGVYFKLPWPFEKISRYAVYRIHEISIGLNVANEKGEERPEVVLWTKSHYAKEAAFLVASDKSSSDNKDVPVSFLNATMPVQYQIRESELINFAYKNEDPVKILKDLGESVATKYFASVDFLKAMSSDRHKISVEIKELLQKEVNNYKLGIDIVYVNLHDVHPPVEKVAPAFQDVIGAREEKETAILNAKAYQKTVVFDAEAQSNKLVKDADTYKTNVVKISKAESERFEKQLSSYKQMPEMFRLRTYLDFLENDCKNIRKFIMSSNIPYEVYEINMEEKARLDLIDANIGEIAK